MISSKSKIARINLIGKKCRLLPFEDKHLRNPLYLKWLRDPEIIKSLNLPAYLENPVTFDHIEAYCRSLWDSPDDLFFALHLVEDGSFIGTLKAGHINWYSGTADLGVMIGARKMWGRGIASEALSLLGSHLIETAKLRRLTAGVMANNPAMIRVFKKLGFKHEGTFRQQDRLGEEYIDHIYLGCLRSEFMKDQS